MTLGTNSLCKNGLSATDKVIYMQGDPGDLTSLDSKIQKISLQFDDFFCKIFQVLILCKLEIFFHPELAGTRSIIDCRVNFDENKKCADFS